MWSTCFSVFLSCCCSKLEHLCVRFLSWKHFLIGSFSIVLFLSHTPNSQIVVPTSFYLHCCALLHLQILLLKVKASLRRYFLEKKTNVRVLWWWEVHLCRRRGWIRLTGIHSDPELLPAPWTLWSTVGFLFFSFFSFSTLLSPRQIYNGGLSFSTIHGLCFWLKSSNLETNRG